MLGIFPLGPKQHALKLLNVNPLHLQTFAVLLPPLKPDG
jgi:hypothetical protein